jgi:hypothetical protein
VSAIKNIFHIWIPFMTPYCLRVLPLEANQVQLYFLLPPILFMILWYVIPHVITNIFLWIFIFFWIIYRSSSKPSKKNCCWQVFKHRNMFVFPHTLSCQHIVLYFLKLELFAYSSVNWWCSSSECIVTNNPNRLHFIVSKKALLHHQLNKHI